MVGQEYSIGGAMKEAGGELPHKLSVRKCPAMEERAKRI